MEYSLTALTVSSVCQTRACAWPACVAMPWPACEGVWDIVKFSKNMGDVCGVE